MFWSTYLLIGACLALVDFQMYKKQHPCRCSDGKYLLGSPLRAVLWPLQIVLVVVIAITVVVWHRLGHPGHKHRHGGEAKTEPTKPCPGCFGDGWTKEFRCPRCGGRSFGSTALDTKNPARSPLERMCHTINCGFTWMDKDDRQHFSDVEPGLKCGMCDGTGVARPCIAYPIRDDADHGTGIR